MERIPQSKEILNFHCGPYKIEIMITYDKLR